MKQFTLNELFPSEIKHEYNSLVLGNKCVCTYVVTMINTNIDFLDTLNNMYMFKDVQMVWDIKKLNSTEYVKKISQMYLVLKTENPQNKFTMDSEIFKKLQKDVFEIRELIQVKNEDVYEVSMYFIFSGDDTKGVLTYARQVQNLLYSRGIIIKPMNFRQLDAYFFSLFFISKNACFQKYISNILTTSSLATLFPYFNRNIIDANGIIFGKVNNSICILNMFSPQYNNRNMCVFGSSGTGKSYFIKSIIIRNMCKGINQIVIDQEGEYGNIVKRLGGNVIYAENINILEFSEDFFHKCEKSNLDVINEKGKIIYNILNFDGKCELGYDKFYNILLSLYKEHGITPNCLYKGYLVNDEFSVNKKFVKKFPTVKDLINKFSKCKEFINITNKLKEINSYTSRDGNINGLEKSNTIVIDFSKHSGRSFEILMVIWLMKLEEDLKENTLIYIDEIWKVLQSGKNKYIANKIIDMYKTIRKKCAGIIGISQDITDIALYGNGELGKGILSNSYFKVFFRMDYTVIEELEKLGFANSSVLDKVKLLDRGKALMSIGGNMFNLEVCTSEYEHDLIVEE